MIIYSKNTKLSYIKLFSLEISENLYIKLWN